MNDEIIQLFYAGMACSDIDIELGLTPGKAHWSVVTYWKAVKDGTAKPLREIKSYSEILKEIK